MYALHEVYDITARLNAFGVVLIEDLIGILVGFWRKIKTPLVFAVGIICAPTYTAR